MSWNQFNPPRPRRRVASPPADLAARSMAEQRLYWQTRLTSALNADQYDHAEVAECRRQLTYLLERRVERAELRASAFERLLRRIRNAYDARDQERLLARVREIAAVLEQHEGDQ